ncbi:hypothetical protein BH09VER1_BH09VER1_22030 [soil metagenome]
MLRYRIALALLLCPLLARADSSPDSAAKWLQKTIAPCFTRNDKVSLAAREKIERTAVAPALKALLARDNDEIARSHEVGRLDFDWIMNAQDVTTDWEVGTPKAEGKNISVPVTTRWGDSNRTHFFLLQPSGDSWLIADVKYPNIKTTLLKILQ